MCTPPSFKLFFSYQEPIHHGQVYAMYSVTLPELLCTLSQLRTESCSDEGFARGWFLQNSASAPHSLNPLCHYLEPPEDGGHSFLEVVPALVALVHHVFELAGRVGAVLAGQAPVLLIDQLQLRQALVDLPLERLQGKERSSFPGNSQHVGIIHRERWCPPP